MLADAAVFACPTCTHVFLGLGGSIAWPPAGVVMPPVPRLPLALLAVGLAVLLASAHRVSVAMLLSGLALLGACWDGWAWWQSGLRPERHAFAAAVYANFAWQAFHLVSALVMGGHLAARAACGLVDRQRRTIFDVVRPFCLYAAAQALAVHRALPWLATSALRHDVKEELPPRHPAKGRKAFGNRELESWGGARPSRRPKRAF